MSALTVVARVATLEAMGAPPPLTATLSLLLVIGTTGVVHADNLDVVVVMESNDRAVSAAAVRERMRASGVPAMGAAEAPAGPVATLAIVYRGAGEETRFRLRTLGGRVVIRDSEAPAADILPWIARRACRMVRAEAVPRANADPRATTEVLDPWGPPPPARGSNARTVVVNPWDDEEEAASTRRRRRRRRRSVGRVAGATVARYSEVLDPWSQASGRDAEVVDPWAHVEGGDGLAPPARRARRRRRRR